MLLNKNDKITQKYDVIIIGGGLGGLTAANKLAKNGRKVLLLESHDKLGGFATWFHRKENIFLMYRCMDFRWGWSKHAASTGAKR